MTERTALRHRPLTSCLEDLDLQEEILSGKADRSVLRGSSGIPLMSTHMLNKAECVALHTNVQMAHGLWQNNQKLGRHSTSL